MRVALRVVGDIVVVVEFGRPDMDVVCIITKLKGHQSLYPYNGLLD